MEGLLMKYFVLNPTSGDEAYAAASRAAMMTFATYMDKHNRTLADDIRLWVINLNRETDNNARTNISYQD